MTIINVLYKKINTIIKNSENYIVNIYNIIFMYIRYKIILF